MTLDRAPAVSVLLAALAVGCGLSHARGTSDAGGTAADAGLPLDARVAVDAGTGPMVTRTVSAGGMHACALAHDRSVWCWGRNDHGQLGDGTTMDRATPGPVLGLPPAVEIRAGALHTCARLEDGTVRCWGENAAGALGDGTTTDSAFPVEVVGLHDAVELALNDNVMPDRDFSCARRATGEVVCWGENATGQLGDGTTASRSVPGAVRDLDDAIALAAGRNHACAIRADRSLVCWGLVGVGETSLVPTPVVGLGPVDAVTAGEAYTCALRADRSVWCWSLLSPGEYVRPALPPTIAIHAGGSDATLAVSADGAVHGWGWSLGLGGGTAEAPLLVPELAHAELDPGGSGGCARLPDGETRCWGFNNHGQVGDGTTTTRTAPVRVDLPSR
jgi:alpha-tubulin suppressor-like RCC1 family protein